MKHVMVDLETFGGGECGMIASIGAVEFDPEGTVLSMYYVAIDPATWPEGTSIDPDMLKWWLDQSDEVRRAVREGAVGARVALQQFADYLYQVSPDRGDIQMWAWPPSFDLVTLGGAYLRNVGRIPWSRRNQMCAKTFVRAAADYAGPLAKPEMTGVRHHALRDAEHQARVVISAARTLRGGL